MALELGTKQTQTTTVDEMKITSFTIDLSSNKILVCYDGLDNNVVVAYNRSILLDPTQTFEAISHASFIAQSDVYSAIKQSLYKSIQEKTGLDGAVM